MSDTLSNYAERWSVMQALVGLTVIAGFFALVFSWMFKPPTTTDAGILAILNQLTGSAGTLAGLVVGYYFGSSKGSQDKDETAKIATRAAADAASTTSATLDKVIGSTGNGNGSPGGTKVVVTPPTPGVTTVETKDTEATAPHAKRGSKRED